MWCNVPPEGLTALYWVAAGVVLLAVLVGQLAGAVISGALSSDWLQDWRDRQYVRQLNKNRGVSSPAALGVIAVACLLAACAYKEPAPPITGSVQWWDKVRAQSW